MKVNKSVNDNSNYSILLTSEFKEHHNEFLSLIELLCELKRKSQKDLESLELDYLKLESIQSYNNQIDSNYSVDDDVLILSHKLMLTKLKSNVQNGIENKISQFNSAKALNVDLAKRTDLQISQLNGISLDRLVDHINTDFIFTSIINKLKSTTISKMDDKKNEETKKNNSTPTNLEKKVIEEYDSLFAKYQTKDKISTSNLNRGNTSDVVSNAETVLENYKSKVRVVASAFDISFEEANEMIKDSDLFIEMVKSLPGDKQWEIYDAFNDEQND